MGHRIQKEFSPDRFKTMSRTLRVLDIDVRLQKDAVRTIDEDNRAIRKEQAQSRTAIAELAVDVGNARRDMGMLKLRMAATETNVWELSSKLRKERQSNREMRKWLEGYMILLFAIVVCFIIVVFVS